MDKQDILYLVIALALVLVIAFFIKPAVTGHTINTGISATTTIPETTTYSKNESPTTPVVKTIITHSPTPSPTPSPVPTWNPNVTQTIGFVNPSSYGISFNQSIPQGTRIDNIPYDSNMTTFATIASSNGSSGTTGIMYIPFPYWELWYTVSPNGELQPSIQKVEPTHGVGISYSGVSGSYSTANPQFTIQVMDGNDPNRIVRTISPPGGIDLDLWTGVQHTAKENSNLKTNQIKIIDTPVPATDPRPWVEKFFEGQRNYFFIISAHSLQSYSIQIRVPSRYIGQY
jgi:hypothetical protein